MSRFRIACLCLLGVALVAAFLPWTVTSDRVASALARQIRNEVGGTFVVGGPITLSLLPAPHLTIQKPRLATDLVTAQADELEAELRLLPLLVGRLRLERLWVSRGRFDVGPPQDKKESWLHAIDTLRTRLASDSGWASRIERLVLAESTIRFVGIADPGRAEVRNVTALVRWPDAAGDLDLNASGTWNGELATVEISGVNPVTLFAGRRDEIEAVMSTREGRIEATGRLTLGVEPIFTGEIAGRVKSLSSLARWTGRLDDLRLADRPASVNGGATVSVDKIEWPRLALEIGRDRFDGTLAVQFDGPRPQIRATLAGDQVDLGWLGPLIDPAGPDRLEGDYDVRLSASLLQIGALRLRDAAASIQAGPRLLEASLGRASYAGGAVRARVSSVLDGEGREIKCQVALDGVDLDKALGDVLLLRGISGTASGQATIEMSGDRGAPLMHQMKGRASLSARDGEVAGTALGEAGRRSSQLPAEWRGGKGRFTKAVLALDLSNGVAEVTEGHLDMAGSATQVTGQMDLGNRTATLRAVTRLNGSTRAPVVVDIGGPLQRPTATAVAAEAPPAASPPR